jgi:chaperonin GroEL
MVVKDRVLFGPQARKAMLRGIDLLTDTLRLTLGPTGRHVAYDPNIGDRPPEILTDGATIARRVIRIPNRYENMGLLLVRHLAWHVRQVVGDGSATSAVLLRALLREATRSPLPATWS